MSKKWLTVGLLVSLALGLTACSSKTSQEQSAQEETVLAIPDNLDGTYEASDEEENYYLTLKNGTGTLISDDGEGNKIVQHVQILDSESMQVDDEYMTYHVQDQQLLVDDEEYNDEGELDPEKVFKRVG